MPLFVNTSTFEFQIVPDASVNVTLTSECSTLTLPKENFNLLEPLVATLNCSVLDPGSVEEGLTVVSRTIGLEFPNYDVIVYPFKLETTLELAPTYYRNRRRLLQTNDPSAYKVCSGSVHPSKCASIQ